MGGECALRMGIDKGKGVVLLIPSCLAFKSNVNLSKLQC